MQVVEIHLFANPIEWDMDSTLVWKWILIKIKTQGFEEAIV